MKKRYLTRILAAMMIACLAFCIAVSATGSDSENYIRFVESDPDSRMKSNGDFTFEFSFSCPSQEFTADGTSITICTSAKVTSPLWGNDEERTSDDLFTLTLYKKSGIFNTEVGKYTGAADGVYGGKKFTNITKGATYYFQLDPVDSNFQNGSKRFKGYGNVSNVTVINPAN